MTHRIHHLKRAPTTFERIHLESLNIPVAQVLGKKGTWLRWNKPEHQQFKLNTDGSCKGGVSAGGGIVRNRQGDFVCGFNVPYEFDDVISAELHALYDNILLCVSQGITGATIEVDAAMVVNMVKDSTKVLWRYVYLLRKVKALIA